MQRLLRDGEFVCKSLAVRQDIEIIYGEELTLREFDNLLIRFANEALLNR